MKLPTDPKERNQIFVLIGLVVVGVCVGIFFGFKSLNDAKTTLRKEIEENETTIRKADGKIKRMAIDNVDNDAAVKEILEISDKYVLIPKLGNNYQLPSREILEGCAKDLDLKIEPVRGLGQAPIPYPSGKGAFDVYSARVSLNCGMHELIRFLHRIETSNPYASVTAITISERRAQDKERAQVSFQLQWPIWADAAQREKLIEQLKEASGPVAAGGADS
jgi:HPt (histidine-containing phosphotransfer) domain-containing protein